MGKKIEGSFVGHSECPKDDCGSSDALAVYKKTDDDGVEFVDGFCYSCERYVSPKELGDDYELVSDDDDDGGDLNLRDLKDIEELRCVGWKERKLKTPVNKLYGVRSSFDPETGEVDARFYPVTKDDVTVGFKKRGLPKNFGGIGNTKATNQLFGQSVFSKGGKYLVITTGEEDALAVAQTLHAVKGEQEFWTPVVSITAGDGSILKQMKANFEYINSFEKVVLMFDQDESGQKHVEEAAKLLNPGKAYIAKLPLKDASDMVKNRRSGDLKQAFWKADRFSPVDVCTLGQLWDEFENAGDEEIIELPFEFTELRRAMGGGPAMGEVTVIGALTSVGKSTILNNIVYEIAFKSPRKVGLLYLESSPKEIVQSFLSIHTEKNLALQDRKSMDMKALKYEFKQMIGDDSNIVTVNHNGSFTSVDEMFEKIRWLIKAAGCDCVFLDPLQAAVPSNENSVIDEFMDNLLKLAKETGASIFVVSHMKKPAEDDPHGVSEYNLKGSSSINQIAFNTILLSRDKTNSDPVIKNTTKLTLVKCRRTGETGDAGWLRYTHHNGRLSAATNPYDDAEEREETMDDFLNGGEVDEEPEDIDYEEVEEESVVSAPKDDEPGEVVEDEEPSVPEEPEFGEPLPWENY